MHPNGHQPAAGPSQPGAMHALEPPHDPDLIPGVEVGQHVVAYYAQHGQDAPVKFFYCLRCVGPTGACDILAVWGVMCVPVVVVCVGGWEAST